MADRQLDLFADAGYRPAGAAAPARSRVAVAALDDAALVAALPLASLGDYRELAAEAGRRRLSAAVPALEALCRRFRGFGFEKAIPEQEAACRALAEIGGPAAAAAVGSLAAQRIVAGPGRGALLGAAARLGVGLPAEAALPLLRDAAPEIRAAACACARPAPQVIARLVELLDDIDRGVVGAAALALGRMGHAEARPALLRMVREAPEPGVIDALGVVADEECLVLLGRLARTRPDLAEAALEALDESAAPRAAIIAAGARGSRPP